MTGIGTRTTTGKTTTGATITIGGITTIDKGRTIVEATTFTEMIITDATTTTITIVGRLRGPSIQRAERSRADKGRGQAMSERAKRSGRKQGSGSA